MLLGVVFDLTGLSGYAIMPLAQSTTRGGAVAARRAHNPKVTGSSPVPATEAETQAIGPAFLHSLTVYNSPFSCEKENLS